MGNPEWTPAVWLDEVALIRIAAAKYGVDWHFVAAIRKVEDGAPGGEFGVLGLKAPSYSAQLEVCCQAVRHRLLEHDQNHRVLQLHETPDGMQMVTYGREFISWFAGVWAPNGASNDGGGINRGWSRKVSYWYFHLIDLEHPA